MNEEKDCRHSIELDRIKWETGQMKFILLVIVVNVILYFIFR